MATCVFDNLTTMCREGWVDGKLMYSFSFDLLYQDMKGFNPLGRKIREWKSGQIFGDPAAMIQTN